MKTKYTPMPGGVLNATTAVIAGKELDRISKNKGVIKPEFVVDAARPTKAALHPFFTWDNSEAAELYRHYEARQLIRSVRITVIDTPQQEQPTVRAFLNVSAAEDETEFEGNGYLPVAKIQERDSYEQQVLDRAKQELRQWKVRYLDYQQYFRGMVKEVLEVES